MNPRGLRLLAGGWRKQGFGCRRTYSTSSSPTPSDLTPQEFHQLADQTLDHLTESLETLVESDHPRVTGWDVDYSVSLTFLPRHKENIRLLIYILHRKKKTTVEFGYLPHSPDRNDSIMIESRKPGSITRAGNLEFMHLMSSEIDSILADNSFSKLYLSPNHHNHHQ
ncbi:hypothetical protein PSHT_12920 [Puccinia striiformis]|uniref:Uncharacterized protein n=1 Tax=Puccinia striiformis TaxID=27350 RepID=A0A2S4UTM1_9BASI|nr:hypothetical protein PSHT_12920 [Puccinia striiformis]